YLFVKCRVAVSAFYRVAVSVLSFFGAVIAATAVWDLADIFNALMIFPNLYLLFIKRKEICSCFGRKKQ
ncbi:MAG: alanine:cation symporter family protein, partial [Eubacteriales bacterium]|nr:alanine:cation symporter family protein [Eubacteriales bacterium]